MNPQRVNGLNPGFGGNNAQGSSPWPGNTPYGVGAQYYPVGTHPFTNYNIFQHPGNYDVRMYLHFNQPQAPAAFMPTHQHPVSNALVHPGQHGPVGCMSRPGHNMGTQTSPKVSLNDVAPTVLTPPIKPPTLHSTPRGKHGEELVFNYNPTHPSNAMN